MLLNQSKLRFPNPVHTVAFERVLTNVCRHSVRVIQFARRCANLCRSSSRLAKSESNFASDRAVRHRSYSSELVVSETAEKASAASACTFSARSFPASSRRHRWQSTKSVYIPARVICTGSDLRSVWNHPHQPYSSHRAGRECSEWTSEFPPRLLYFLRLSPAWASRCTYFDPRISCFLIW
jgi:hypothetical protein